MKKRCAMGCHVFAGGFTAGVQQMLPVPQQLEVHGLGSETVPTLGVEFVCCPAEEWPAPPPGCVMLFGNPRCTGFSCLSGGCDENTHGPWSGPTIDIHQFMQYGVKHDIPLLCWESVQQARTVGRPLLDHLVNDLCLPNGYRVAHLLINAATFGNAQQRKRYFFVAYKRDHTFNVKAPPMLQRWTTVGDVILTSEFKQYKTRPVKWRNNDWDADCYTLLCENDRALIPHMPQNFDVNHMAEFCYDVLPEAYKDRWDWRVSTLPFSLHSAHRLIPEHTMPVISSSSFRFVHPIEDRTLTLRELARLMGWPPSITPVGDHPIGQIGKGVVPAVGTWLAEQCLMYLDDAWGGEDWESSYCSKRNEWVGKWLKEDQPEKTFNLTKFGPQPLKKRPRHEYLQEHKQRVAARGKRAAK